MATAADLDQPASQPATFDTPTILSVAGAHLVHDTYPAFVGVLLPLLIPKLGISLAMAGLLAATFRLATGVQPILGVVADRADTRYWIILAPLATAIAIGLLGLAPATGVVALLLVLAGLSSAVFHPAAAALVTRSSGREWGRGTSIFMTGGESGRAIGPVVIAIVLAAVGLEWSWIAIVPGAIASAVLYTRLAHRPQVHLAHRAGSVRSALRSARRGFLLLAAASAMMSMAGVGLLVFIPTYLTGAGAGIVLAGTAVTAFEIGGATGAFLGGTLSDRIGRRAMLAIASGVGAPLLILALAMPVGPLMLVVLAVAGVAAAQRGPGAAGADAGAAARQPRRRRRPEHLRDHDDQRPRHARRRGDRRGDRAPVGAPARRRCVAARAAVHRPAARDPARERRNHLIGRPVLPTACPKG